MRFRSWSPKAHISLLLGVCWVMFMALALPATAVPPIPIPVQDSTIGVKKVASDKTVYIGQTITYTITIKNKGTDALRRITVIDPILGDLTDEFFPKQNTLDVDASVSLDVEYTVDAGDVVSGVITNTVVVLGIRGKGRNAIYVYNEDIARINVEEDNIEEGLEIEKTAEPTEACPGDIVKFTVTIRNTGDARLVKVRVDDDLYKGNLTELFFPGATPRVLNPGDELTREYCYTVKPYDIGTLVNKAKVSAIPQLVIESAAATLVDGGESLRIFDEDEATVEVTQCDLQVTKIANRGSAQPGSVVQYTISITNNGEVTLTNVKVEDNVMVNKDLTEIFFPGTTPHRLTPGETITRTVSYKVKPTDPNPLCNTVVVTARQPLPSVPGAPTLLVDRDFKLLTATATACVKRCSAGGGIEPGQQAYPDMIIYNAAYKNCTGDNIYNTTGIGQVMPLTAATCGISFPVRFENDTMYEDGVEILITGTEGGNGWTVKYFDAKNGGNDITDQVTHGGWNPSCGPDKEMAPNQARDFLVVVTPNSGVVCGDIETVLITATIKGTTVSDTVKACVKKVN